MAKSAKDLMRVTGLSETSVYLALELGELPGYRVGRRWVITDDAFDDFCHGRWQPKPKNPFPHGIKPLKQPTELIRKIG